MHYVYALHNKEANKLYIGETSRLAQRIREHNTPVLNKGHFTSRFPGTWQLLYHEELPSRKEALMREKQLKSHEGRDFLRTLINNIPE